MEGYGADLLEKTTNEAIFKRERVDRLFAKASEKAVVSVVAGAGYGKTMAVNLFLTGKELKFIWCGLSEKDNFSERFWDNFNNSMASHCTNAKEKMTGVGFPKNALSFALFCEKFAEIVKENEIRFLVFDDLHLCKSPEVLKFVESLIEQRLPFFTLVLISRKEIDLNLVSCKLRGGLASITEGQLHFTKQEIQEYCESKGIEVSGSNLQEFYEKTAGWSAAVFLLCLSMGTALKPLTYFFPAVKEDLYRLLENEVFDRVSPDLQNLLMKVSSLDSLPLPLLHKIAGEKPALVHEFGSISSFIYYDMYTNCYFIHSLFREFLNGKWAALTEPEDMADVYTLAGDWYCQEKRKIDGIMYYEKAGDYQKILSVLKSDSIRCSFHTALYIQQVLGRVPESLCLDEPMIYILRARLWINNFMVLEAVQELENFDNIYRNLPSEKQNPELLGESCVVKGLISLITCAETETYDFLEYFQKAKNLLPNGSTIIDGEMQMCCGSYMCLVRYPRPNVFENAIIANNQLIPLMSEVMHGCGYGMAELAEMEVYYLRRNFKKAEMFAAKAMVMAREKSNYDVECTAIFYCIKIKLCQGDHKRIVELLRRMAVLVEKSKQNNCRVLQDIYVGWYYAQVGAMDKIPAWILDYDESKKVNSPITFAMDHLVRAKYLYANKQYYELIAVLEEQLKEEKLGIGIAAYLVGKIDIRIFMALTYYRLGEKSMAVYWLQEAYLLAEVNHILMPFIENAAGMRSLALYALSLKECSIPAEWLEEIKKKTSAYDKKLAFVSSREQVGTVREALPELSKREQEILQNLCQGLTREELADEFDLSINTVKSMLQSIYTKLGAVNSYDAIRIASKMGLDL